MAVPHFSYGGLAVPLGAYHGYKFGKGRNRSKFPVPEMAIGGAAYLGTDKAVRKINKLLNEKVVQGGDIKVGKKIEDMLKKRGVTLKKPLPKMVIRRPGGTPINIGTTLLGLIASGGVADMGLEAYQRAIPNKLKKRQAHRRKYDVV